MSKDLFTQMREVEIFTDRFLPTKNEITISAEKFAKELIESGNLNMQEKYAEVRRLKEVVDVIESEFKKALPDENFEAFGLKATYRNGGSIANYEEDSFYASLKRKLEERKMQLDLALKTDEVFYDGTGEEVPKVSKTERKGSLSISF